MAACASATQVGLVVLMAALAVLQDARILAQVALLGGLASPILVSDGSGNYVALFSYLSLLNCGVAMVAWFKSWRSLNLIGAPGTLAIGSAWGIRDYQPAFFAVCEAALLFHLVLYTVIVWRFAHRQSLSLTDTNVSPEVNNAPLAQVWQNWLNNINRVSLLDSGLLFGVSLSTFVLQIYMVQQWDNAASLSSLGFALFYALFGLLVWRTSHHIKIVSDAMFALALIFATAALVFLDSEGYGWRSTFLCLEATLVYGFSIKQRLPLARAFAVAVFVINWLVHLGMLDFSLTTGFIVLAAGAVFALLWQMYRRNQAAQWETISAGMILGLTFVLAAAIPLRLQMLGDWQLPWALWVIGLQAAAIYAFALWQRLPLFRAFAVVEFSLVWLAHLEG